MDERPAVGAAARNLPLDGPARLWTAATSIASAAGRGQRSRSGKPTLAPMDAIRRRTVVAGHGNAVCAGGLRRWVAPIGAKISGRLVSKLSLPADSGALDEMPGSSPGKTGLSDGRA
jgi:hypothetical protein